MEKSKHFTMKTSRSILSKTGNDPRRLFCSSDKIRQQFRNFTRTFSNLHKDLNFT